MTIDEIGATAFLIAAVRALEDGQDKPLFSDAYASLFVNDEWMARARKLMDVHFAVGDAIRLRTMALNKVVEDEIARGVRQVVTLGCGFDMRQAIYAGDGVRFFDVDQLAVLDFKADVLDRAGIPMCSSVACDYLEVDLPALLLDLGLDRDEQALFVWEGNTMYLSGDRVFGFLERLCDRIGRFRVGFDYLLKSVLDGTYEDAEAVAVVRDVQKAMGVVFQTGFDSLEQFETDVPFSVIESGNVLDVGIRRDSSQTDEMFASERLASTAGLSEAFAGVYRLALIERR